MARQRDRGVLGRRGILVMVVVAFGAFVGGPAAPQEFRPTVQKIKETGIIDLGYREASHPFSFRDKDGRPTGYSVDLCQQVATALKASLKLPELKLSWVPVTPADRLTKLVKGQVDLGCESSTITFARMEQVAFSHMIFVDGGSLLATVASGVERVKDLPGKRVGVIPHTTTEKTLAAALRRDSTQAHIVAVTEHSDGLRGLEAGQLDAYASDRVLLSGLLAKASGPTKLRLSREFYSYEPYALMLRRGDNVFQVEVNRVLSQLYRSGQIVPIYERWFGPFADASPLVQALYLLHSWPE